VSTTGIAVNAMAVELVVSNRRAIQQLVEVATLTQVSPGHRFTENKSYALEAARRFGPADAEIEVEEYRQIR
jgi:hypothetical protein